MKVSRAFLLPALSLAILSGVLAALVLAPAALQAQKAAGGARAGKQIYDEACLQCHGPTGTGAAATTVAFGLPLPDLSDCNFTREPDHDWHAVVHDGGPARAFNRLMPAFGDVLSPEEIELVIAHVRGFCDSRAWPRGELNFPRAIATEKAFPEDEVMFATSVAAEGAGSVANKLIYEKRVGARGQVEVIVPFSSVDAAPGGWSNGIGDVAFGIKRAMYHDRRRGTIFSLAGEVAMPTGNSDRGFGGGHWVFESFAAFGQALPGDAFLQGQAGMGFPTTGPKEAFWRLVAGKSLVEGAFGRTWSPMVEVLAARDLEDGAKTAWDVVPEFQVTLSRRQHIMAAAGVRIPLTDRGPRGTKLVAYVIWDWFDGGLFSAWK